MLICKDKIIKGLIEARGLNFDIINEANKRFIRTDVSRMKPELLMAMIHDLSFVPEGQSFDFTISGGIMKIALGQL